MKAVKRVFAAVLAFAVLVGLVPSGLSLSTTVEAAVSGDEAGVRLFVDTSDASYYNESTDILTVQYQVKIPESANGITSLRSYIYLDANRLQLMPYDGNSYVDALQSITIPEVGSGAEPFDATDYITEINLGDIRNPYNIEDAKIITDRSNNAVLMVNLLGGGGTPTQDTDEWQTAYTIKFYVNGNFSASSLASALSDNLRIADPDTDSDMIAGVDTSSNEYVASFRIVSDDADTGTLFGYKPLANNEGIGETILMSAPGNGLSIIPGGDTMPEIAVAKVTILGEEKTYYTGDTIPVVYGDEITIKLGTDNGLGFVEDTDYTALVSSSQSNSGSGSESSKGFLSYFTNTGEYSKYNSLEVSDVPTGEDADYQPYIWYEGLGSSDLSVKLTFDISPKEVDTFNISGSDSFSLPLFLPYEDDGEVEVAIDKTISDKFYPKNRVGDDDVYFQNYTATDEKTDNYTIKLKSNSNKIYVEPGIDPNNPPLLHAAWVTGDMVVENVVLEGTDAHKYLLTANDEDNSAVTNGTISAGNIFLTTADQPLETEYTIDNPYQIRLGNTISFAVFLDAVLGEFKGHIPEINSASSNLGIDNSTKFITAISENSAPIEVVIKSLAIDANSDGTDEYRETDISVYVDVVPKDLITIPFESSDDVHNGRLTYDGSPITLADIGNFDFNAISDSALVDTLEAEIKYYNLDPDGEIVGDARTSMPTSAGDYRVEINYETDDSIYSGGTDFTIKPLAMTNANTTVNFVAGKQNFTYNTYTQTPVISSIVVGGVILTTDDYYYSGASDRNATNAGNYQLVLNGQGNFSGTAFADWSIAKLAINSSNAVVVLEDHNGTPANGNLTFNKVEQTQLAALRVTSNDTGDLDSTYYIPVGNYTLSGNTGTNAGDYTMTLTAVADGNITGTLTDIPWAIEKADIAVLSYSGLKEYNGKTDLEGLTTLSSDSLQIEWEESGTDVYPGRAPAFGSDYTVSGTLSSQYVASRNINDFKIVPTENSPYFDNFNIIYNGSSFIAEVTAVEQPITVNSSNESTNSQSNPYILKINSEHTITDLFEGEIGAVTDVTITYPNGNTDNIAPSVSADKSTIGAGGVSGETVAKVDVDFAAVNVDNRDGDEYLETTKTIYVKVIDKNPVDATVTARDKTYDGNAYDPNMFVTVTGIPAGLTKTYTYYTIDTMDPIGESRYLPEGAPTNVIPHDSIYYIVEVTAEDADNRYIASDTFKINPFELTSANTTITLGSDLVYNSTEQTRDFDVTVTGFDDVIYNINSGSDKGTNAGDYNLSITGIHNFKGTVTKAWEIEKLPVTVTSFEAAKDYDKTTSLNGLSVTELLFASDIPDDHSYSLTTDYTISGTLTSANGGTGIGISNFSITPVANTELANYDISISETAGTVDVTIDKIALPDGYSITSDTVDIIYNRAITDMPFSIDLEFPADSGTIKYDPLKVSTMGDTVGFRGVDITTKTSNNMIEVTYDGTQISSGGSMKYIIPFETQNYIIPNNYELIINFVEKYSTDVEVTGKTEVTYGDADFTLGKSAKIPGEGVGVWSFESSDTDVLEVDSTTGKVTIVGAGSATITASYESDTHKGSDTINITVAQKTISFSGVTVHDKEYDGNTTATYDESGLTVTGLVTSLDSLGIDGLRFTVEEATFDNKNAGTNKTVTVIYTITATADISSIEVRGKIIDYFDNYIIPDTTTHKATIEKKGLTATETAGVIFRKIFDGTTDAIYGSDANIVTFNGLVSGESIDYSHYTRVDFKYDSADVGTDKTVTGSIKLAKTAVTDNYYLINSNLTYENQMIIATDPAFRLPTTIYVTEGTQLSAVTFDTTFIGVDKATESGALSFAHSGSPITDYTFTGAVGTTTMIDYIFTPSNSNYGAVHGNVRFTITDKTPIFVTVEDVDITYGDTFDWDTELVVTAKTADGTEVTGSYSEGVDSYPSNVGDGVVNIVFTPDDSRYEKASAVVRYVINKAKITGTPTFTKVSEAGKTLGDIVYDLSGISPAPVVVFWEGSDEIIIEQGVSYNYVILKTIGASIIPDFNYEGLSGSVVLWENSAVTPPPVNQFTITASAGEGGTISPSGTVSVLKGATPTFTITPNAGYEIESVIIDESLTLNVSSYTFAAIDASHSIRATFRLATDDNTDDEDDSSSQSTGNEGDEDDGTDGTDGDGTGDEGDSEDDSSSSSSGTAADNATDVSVTLPSTDKEITSVTVGSETLTENDYTIEGGNLIISEEFIKTLSVGEHTVTVNYEDESYTATIEISDSSAPTSSGNFIPAEPEDEGGSMLPIVLAIIGLAVAGGIVFFIIRKKNAPNN